MLDEPVIHAGSFFLEFKQEVKAKVHPVDLPVAFLAD